MVGIDYSLFIGFSLLEPVDIFNILGLNPYEDYHGHMIKERYEKVSRVLHLDRRNNSSRTPPEGLNQKTLNMIIDFLFPGNETCHSFSDAVEYLELNKNFFIMVKD